MRPLLHVGLLFIVVVVVDGLVVRGAVELGLGGGEGRVILALVAGGVDVAEAVLGPPEGREP